MANQAFLTWAFKAAGAPTARTMPDRLSEIVNVKDWGAAGVGGNYTAEIQAAIDYAMDQGGGIVFFPQGSYNVTSPLIVGGDADAPVYLLGCGKEASSLTASTYTDPSEIGYMISGGTEDFDCLARMEGITCSLNIKATRDGFSIEDCFFSASTTVGEPIGLNTAEATGVLARSCTTSFTTTHSMPDDPSPGEIRGCEPDTIGYALGSASTAAGCNVIGGYEIGYALSGEGTAIVGCRGETHGNCIRVGWGPDGETPSYGATIQGVQMERVMWPVVLYNATGCVVTGVHTGAGEGLPVAEACTLTWSSAAGGTATITCTGGAHNVAAGTYVIQLAGVTAWIPDAQESGIVEVTVGAANTFTYPLTPDPGAADAVGTWGWPMEYNVRVRKAYECAIIGNNFGAKVAYGIDLDYDGEAEHRNCVFAGVRSSYGWIMPTDSTNLAAWTFIGAGPVSALAFLDSPNALHPHDTMVFADLPDGLGVQDGPYEGQEFNITDGDDPVFDSEQTGGGSGNYKVRYNGSVWKRIG